MPEELTRIQGSSRPRRFGGAAPRGGTGTTRGGGTVFAARAVRTAAEWDIGWEPEVRFMGQTR